MTSRGMTIIANKVSIHTHTHTRKHILSVYAFTLYFQKHFFRKNNPKNHDTEFPSCISKKFIISFKEKNIGF